MFVAALSKKGVSNPHKAWIHDDKDTAIRAAIKHTQANHLVGYSVLVGEISGEAKLPEVQYEVVPIDTTNLK